MFYSIEDLFSIYGNYKGSYLYVKYKYESLINYLVFNNELDHWRTTMFNLSTIISNKTIIHKTHKQ
jgi:hypothetical protein